jgi:PAS domain S-box-containing protein
MNPNMICNTANDLSTDGRHVYDNVPLEGKIFRILSDQSPRPMLIANENVEIEYVNAAWEKQFGYLLEEVRGKNPRILQSGKTPRLVYEKMWKTLRAGRIFKSDEIIDRKKNGTFFNLFTTTFPIRSENSLHYIQILDDITKAKRVEEFRKHFVKIAAHDIRSPLQSLKLITELESHSHSDENMRDIQEEISRMDRLTRLLLDVSLFESGKMQLSLAHFDLSKVVEDAVDRKHVHSGKVIFKNPKRIIVRGDQERIMQVLINLIENALKYSRTKKSVIVSLSKKGVHSVVSVSDEGKGIPKHEVPHLFDAFFRTKAAAKSSISGSGLGLYIVKEIIRAHKGRIWVKSREGVGSTFSFSLPAVATVRTQYKKRESPT